MRQKIPCGIILVMLLLAGLFPARGFSKPDPQKLSPEAEVSLLTIEPGNQLYSLFGHTALRISDPVTGIDQTYNYGTFDFKTEGFYWKFALGNLQYSLSVVPFEVARNAYLKEGRNITEQRLNLTAKQTQRLLNYLKVNAKPENRYYSYEFFYDNCTTRIYDAIRAATGNAITFRDSLKRRQKSFRASIVPYLEKDPWLKMGINLLLGAPADHVPNGSQRLFLPDLLKEGVDRAVISIRNKRRRLVEQTETYMTDKSPTVEPAMITPSIFFWILLAAIGLLSFYSSHKRTPWRWVDSFLFGFTGLVGLLLLFLWLFSAYEITKWNINIIWTLPAVVGFFLVFFKTGNRLWRWYCISYLTLATGLLASWILLPQTLPAAVFPLLLLLVGRSMKRSYDYHPPKLKSWLLRNNPII